MPNRNSHRMKRSYRSSSVGIRSFAMVIRPHGFSAVPLAIGEDTLASDVDDLREAFVPVGGRPAEFDLKSAYQLYRALLAPLADRLTGVDHLIVVPGPVLANLPLATLVTDSPIGGDYLHAAWLVRRFALSEVPSLLAFVTLKQESAVSRIATRPFLGLGDSAFPGRKWRRRRDGPRGADWNLPRCRARGAGTLAGLAAIAGHRTRSARCRRAYRRQCGGRSFGAGRERS